MICISSFFILLLLYKLLDWLIRLSYIGRYSERYILVTGCDTGFGNLLVKRLDKLGCYVFAGCLTEVGETELKKSSSDRMTVLSLDVSKSDSVRHALDVVKAKLPPGKGLWGLMNNAGIFCLIGPPEWYDMETYRRVCDVNLFGLIDMTMTFLPLVKMEHGRIVNTSSVAARLSLPFFVPYTVSKFGVEAFTDGLRRSLDVYGCKAILIEPGGHKTLLISSLRSNAVKGWNRMSAEMKAEFGEDYFNYFSSDLIFSQLMKSAADPNNVAAAYEHALLGSYPRIRYVIGLDGKLFYLPLAALPEWLSDWILHKLFRYFPLPAALRK